MLIHYSHSLFSVTKLIDNPYVLAFVLPVLLSSFWMTLTELGVSFLNPYCCNST